MICAPQPANAVSAYTQALRVLPDKSWGGAYCTFSITFSVEAGSAGSTMEACREPVPVWRMPEEISNAVTTGVLDESTLQQSKDVSKAYEVCRLEAVQGPGV